MPSISFDLVYLICQYIQDKRDLCSLAMVSLSTQIAAEYFIYRQLRVEDPVSLVLICRRVCNTPRIRTRVRSLAVEFFARNPKSGSFWILFAKALRLLPALQHLVIRLSFPYRAHQFEMRCSSILGNCTFQLQSFSTTFPIDHRLISFLQTQRGLRYLQLDSWHFDPMVLVMECLQIIKPPKFLPKLVAFHGEEHSLATRLVPYRPISHLRFRHHNDDRLLSIPSPIALSTAAIKHLDIVNLRPNREGVYKMLPTVAPELETLSGVILAKAPIATVRLRYDVHAESLLKNVSGAR
jgi:hypothetical protein